MNYLRIKICQYLIYEINYLRQVTKLMLFLCRVSDQHTCHSYRHFNYHMPSCILFWKTPINGMKIMRILILMTINHLQQETKHLLLVQLPSPALLEINAFFSWRNSMQVIQYWSNLNPYGQLLVRDNQLECNRSSHIGWYSLVSLRLWCSNRNLRALEVKP